MKLIPLTQGLFAQVDDKDFEYLNQWKWRANKNGNTFYAISYTRRINGKRTAINMHRTILGLTDSNIISDHKDHNGLNNQRDNLRVATKAQNSYNRKYMRNATSKYIGVYWFKRDLKWKGSIKKDGKSIHLGMFNTEEECATAYNKKAIELFGEFASINHLG